MYGAFEVVINKTLRKMSWMSKLGKVLMPERITNYFKLKQDLNEMEKTSGNSLFNQILEFRNTQQIMKDFLREDDFKKKVESIGQSTQACIKSLREAPNPVLFPFIGI